MKRLGGIIILLIIAWAGITIGLRSGHNLRNNTTPIISSVPLPHTQTTSPQATIGIPQTLKIPKINVSTTIEQVGLDPQGRMAVPSSSDTVGWYKLGYKPGEQGNAVIDGHLDRVTGAPAVFWDINKLGPGDQIIITDSQGKQYTFSVVNTNTYPDANFPIKEVFGSSDKRILNLITCHGTWDAANHNYSDRVVVSAELVQ